MTLRKEAPRAKSRWLTLAAVVGAFTLVFGAIALASPGPLPGSNFEGDDGNLIVNTAGNTDWANVAGLHAGVDLPSGKTDNSFGQGTKEDNAAVTVVTGSIPPNKNDLTRFYEASETVGANTYLYLAWERAVNIGNANLDFEINQKTTAGFTGTTTGAVTLNRTAGDLLVTYDFGGSGTPTLGILRWVTSASVPVVPDFATNTCFSANSFPCWGDQKTLDATEAEGAVNTVAVSDPIAPNAPRTLAIGTFGEAAINLTTSGVFPAGGPCLSLGSTFLKSRSSSSFTAEVKDFVAPVPVSISNCAAITIIKHTDPRGFDQDFSYSTNVPSTGTNAATFSKTPDTTGATTTFTLNDSGNTTADSTGNTESITNVHPGSYTVTEGTEPANFLLESLTCTTGGAQHAAGSPQADITVAAGDLVTCTYVNQHQKATPSVATQIHLDDTATLSGGDSPTGDVTFQLYDNAGCTGNLVAEFDNVALSGSSATTVGVTPDSGNTDVSSGNTYSWKVTYNGDTLNNAVTVGCTDISHETAAISYAP
jgi:hypothetical protein